MLDKQDYVATALFYARKASLERNRDRFGKWIRLAARRFLADYYGAIHGERAYTFDEWNANDVCDFIEKLPHVEGVWDSPFIVLHESHVFFLVNLFGFRKANGTRRFTQALFCVARKNAKSTLAAAIGLYCETCEGEMGPQVITAATTGQQARIVFNVAKKMVEHREMQDLRDHFQLAPFANAIACYSNLGTYKPINAKASTQDGLNPSTTILDEIHAHKNHDLMNVLLSAAGARKNPLVLITTTEGYESEGPWPELRVFSEQMLEGVVEADHFLALIFALDAKDDESKTPADDEFDETKWQKANPLMSVNPYLADELRKLAIEAKQMPGRHAEFKIKRANLRESAQGRWVNLTKWKLNTASVDTTALRKHECYGGLDLASTTDLASFRLVWPMGDRWSTKGWRFVTRDAVKNRAVRQLIPYEKWVAQGHLIIAGESVIDYDIVRETILAANAEFDIVRIAYDTWNAAQIASKLDDAGLVMVPFIQGPKSYHPAMRELERTYVAGKLAHGNDPVLNWCVSNLVARLDVNMNQAPDKKRAVEKIDDAAALLMGMGTAIGTEEDEPDIAAALRAPVFA